MASFSARSSFSWKADSFVESRSFKFHGLRRKPASLRGILRTRANNKFEGIHENARPCRTNLNTSLAAHHRSSLANEQSIPKEEQDSREAIKRRGHYSNTLINVSRIFMYIYVYSPRARNARPAYILRSAADSSCIINRHAREITESLISRAGDACSPRGVHADCRKKKALAHSSGVYEGCVTDSTVPVKSALRRSKAADCPPRSFCGLSGTYA